MARFTFKLEGVLRQRKHVEQEKMRALAVTLKHQAECEMEFQRLSDAVQQTNDDLRRNHLTGLLDMSFLSAHRRFMNAMHRQSAGIQQKIAQAKHNVTEARIALGEAAKQRKVMEKLREKHHERWRSEQAAKEFRELDEIGVQLAVDLVADDIADQTTEPMARAGGDL
jgi:flagellar FliJ protein